MKRCPYCAEEIQDAAIKCRFCSSDLTAPTTIIAAPPAPAPVAPTSLQPRVASMQLSTKGAEIWFTAPSIKAVSDLLASFFNSNGFVLEKGSAEDGTYGLGSSTARVFGGGLVKRQLYSVAVSQGDGFVYATLDSAMTGWSGSLVGVVREQSGRTAFSAQLLAFLAPYR